MAKRRARKTSRTSSEDPYSGLLRGGAALILGDDAEILAHRASLPEPFWRQDLLNRRVADLTPPALGNLLQRLWQTSQSRRRPAAAEIALAQDPDRPAEIAFLSMRVAPHPETPDLSLVTLRDLTRDRTRNRELLQRVEELEKDRTTWEDRARTLAHDMRSSLSALTGFVKMALREEDGFPPKASEALYRALAVAERLDEMARSTGSGREGKSDPPAPELGQLAPHLFAELRAAHPDVPFTWCADACDAPPKVSASALWEILWNLASNAVNYRSPHRTLHVELRAWPENDELWIEVRDNGRGIPAGEEETLFVRHWRDPAVRDVPGTGLGLFGARRLAEKCRGRIWARALDEGAAFTVAFPRAEAQGSASRSPAADPKT